MSESRADFRVVIPARYASERLPGKPLLDICGRPMLEHVWRRAMDSGAGEVWIATDDARIEAVATAFGARVMRTDPAHASGTDRVAEVAERLCWPADAVVVNVQGDEPLIPPANIAQVAELCAAGAGTAMATLSVPLGDAGELADPNVVKLVRAADGRALYFSRAPVPFARDPGGAGGPVQPSLHRRHVGLYAYRVSCLRLLASTPPCPLESCEKLEQLRALWLGLDIRVADAREPPPAGVDVAQDLERVRRLVQELAATVDNP
jgi:3-deoxy-manno-octulosonate cytidylyltransferase (CMP-KDO synthetase)